MGGINNVYDYSGSSTYRFGEGFDPNPDNLKLYPESLRLDFGPSTGSGQAGDEVHIMNFNQQDVFNSLVNDRFEFADGTVLTTGQLLARGFDIDGTNANDVITGLYLPLPKMVGGKAGPMGYAAASERMRRLGQAANDAWYESERRVA